MEQSPEGMYRSLILQIFEELPRLKCHLDRRRKDLAQKQGWTLTLLEDLFHDIILDVHYERLVCYIDALDESQEDQIRRMVETFRDIGDLVVSEGIQFYVCFSSRHYPHIRIESSEKLVLEDQEGHTNDISRYVRKRLNVRAGALKYSLITQIEQRASGVFLWVVLVVRLLNLNQDSDNGYQLDIQRHLEEIPIELDDIFQDMLGRGSPSQYLLPLLQLLIFARKPLTLEELYFALQSQERWDPNRIRRLTDLDPETLDKFILHASKGLAETGKGERSTVQLIHESVRTFVLDAGLQHILRAERKSTRNATGRSHDMLRQCCENYLRGIPLAPVREPSTVVS